MSTYTKKVKIWFSSKSLHMFVYLKPIQAIKLKRNENNLLGCRWSTPWFSVTQFLLTRAQEKEEFFFLISPFCQKSFFCPLLWFYLLPPTALIKVCLLDPQLYLMSCFTVKPSPTPSSHQSSFTFYKFSNLDQFSAFFSGLILFSF